jgi:hypothetical protein
MTITSIYSRLTLLFIILNIIKEKKIRPINITDINGLAFSLNIHRQSNIIFTISLYKIDKILKGRKKDDKELLQ